MMDFSPQIVYTLGIAIETPPPGAANTRRGLTLNRRSVHMSAPPIVSKPRQKTLDRWIGQRFDRLTVVSFCRYTDKLVIVWNCICDCGNTCTVLAHNLTSKRTRSCGCLSAELDAMNQTTHGMSYTRTYRTWGGMIARCRNSKDARYPYYGGRGIGVCARWLQFENFLADMGEAPQGMSIDRIDVNGNYEPSNCRWANDIIQSNNRRNNVVLEYDGRSMTVAEWARFTGISQPAIRARLRYGWSVERTLTTPLLNSPRSAVWHD